MTQGRNCGCRRHDPYVKKGSLLIYPIFNGLKLYKIFIKSVNESQIKDNGRSSFLMGMFTLHD